MYLQEAELEIQREGKGGTEGRKGGRNEYSEKTTGTTQKYSLSQQETWNLHSTLAPGSFFPPSLQCWEAPKSYLQKTAAKPTASGVQGT